MTRVDLHFPLTPAATDQPLLGCRVSRGGGWVVIALSGELDMSTVADVRAALIDLQLPFGVRFAVDLRELSFMDSTGVRVILQAMAQAERHCAEFVVVRGPDAVQRMLEVVGLADQLAIVDDLPAAARG